MSESGRQDGGGPRRAPLEEGVDRIYRDRFPETMHERRRAAWRALCAGWFSRFVEPGDRVLEIAAGYCEFINAVRCREKVAVDLNPDTRLHAAAGVEVRTADAARLGESLPEASFDVAFTSNFLEHCRDREHVLDVLRSAFAVLRPGGRLLVMGPNWKYAYREYFDFFDHRVALSHEAVREALRLAGFEVELVVPRFLPFSFKSRLPSHPALIRLYLWIPAALRPFAKQFFLVARRPEERS